MSLSQLLKKVDKAFGLDKKPAGNTYAYYIGPIGGLWQFRVVDNWYEWLDNNYKDIFFGFRPEEAVNNFLEYIQKNKINPAKLRHR